MSTLVAPVDPMAAEGKDTVLEILRRDMRKFFELAEDPANWNVQTRCTEWEVRDLVGHMIDVTEGYLSRWEVAKRGARVYGYDFKQMPLDLRPPHGVRAPGCIK